MTTDLAPHVANVRDAVRVPLIFEAVEARAPRTRIEPMNDQDPGLACCRSTPTARDCGLEPGAAAGTRCRDIVPELITELI